MRTSSSARGFWPNYLASRGEGPAYFRLGKFVFYRLADLVAYKAKHAVERPPIQADLL